MFGLSTQDKIKKLLITNTNLSITVKKAYDESLKDKTEIGQLKTEQTRIDLAKICFTYDELKYGYKGFFKLDKYDKWKLNKPLESEGAIFDILSISLGDAIAYFEPAGASNIILTFKDFSFATHLVSNSTYQQQSAIASSILQKGLKHKLAHQYIDEAEKIFGKQSKTVSMLTLLNYYLLYEYLTTASHNTTILEINYLTLHTNKALLELIAKLTNTNIIVGKEF